MQGKFLFSVLFIGVLLGFPIRNSSAELVITEIMVNPAAVSDANGEWFEVFNSGATEIDLNGFTFAEAGGAFTVNSSLVVASGQYLVFGRSGNTSVNGGLDVDYDYPNARSLNNDIDYIEISFEGTQYDIVSWDANNSWPIASGSSMQLVGTNPHIDNNIASNWMLATTTYGDGDFGTPGTGLFSAVPEPTSLAYGAIALTTLALRRRRRR